MSTRRFPEGNNTSPHRRSLFNKCPAAHHHQYVDKWSQGPEGPEATIGKAIHSVIESAAIDVGHPDPENPAPGTGPAVFLSVDSWDAYVEQIGAQLVATPSDLAEVHDRLIAGMNLIDLSNQLCAPEEPWTVHLGDGLVDGGIWDMVRSDRGRVVVTDWKTGDRPAPTPDQLREDTQAGAYLVAARNRWPDASGWSTRFVYLAQGVAVEAHWDRGLDDMHRRWARSTAIGTQSGYSKPRVGAHCGTCPFRDRCKAYEKAVQVEVGAEPTWGDPAALLAEAHRIRVLEALVEGRKQSVTAALRAFMEQRSRHAGVVGVTSAAHEAVWCKRTVRKIDTGVVGEVARILSLSTSETIALLAVAVSTRRLDALVKAHPELGAVVAARTSRFEVRWPEVRELDGEAT